MGKVNVYLPDELEKQVRAAGISISPVCQTALQSEVERHGQLAKLQGTMSRIVLQDGEVEKAFEGRLIASNERMEVYLTKGGRLVLSADESHEMRMWIFDTFGELTAEFGDEPDAIATEFLSAVAQELGENYVVELAI